MNDRLIQALRCRNTSRPPVWVMRQAGRYLPEYRAMRQQYTFLEMCHHPDLIAEVTLMPIKRFDFDAAIIFSDILIIPEAMGLGLRFEENLGPILERPICSPSDIECLPNATNIESLKFVAEGIKKVRNTLQVPLLGFCGAPFTLASYMIEGKSSRDLKATKRWMFSNPASFHKLLTLLADWCVALLNMQIQAGVQAVQIFDSWSGYLAFAQFEEFSLNYFDRIIKNIVKKDIPIILYCKGSSVFAPLMATAKPAAISIDWNADLAEIRKVIPESIALQGNLDPDVLFASPLVIEREVNRILDKMQGDKGFIFNLGHGILPGVPLESVQVLIDCVKKRELCASPF